MASTKEMIAAEDTLSKLLLRNYKKWGDKKVAMRNKDFGIWQEYTWKDEYEKVKYFALGLASLGLKWGDRVCIIGDNEPEWYWAEFAAQSLGGAGVGIFVDCVPDEVEYIAGHSESTFAVARDQEQIDKILAIRERCPLLKKAIYWDPKGMYAYEDDPFVMDFKDVVKLGREYEKEHPGFFEEEVEKGTGEDICILCYTSGTTGLPKGALVQHRNLITTVSQWFEIDPWYPEDDYLSYVAPAWITEQLFGIAGGIVSGATINFPEEPETMMEDVREIGPSMILYTSRLWESLCATVQAKMDDTGFIKRLAYGLFLPVGYKVADTVLEHREPNLFWRGLRWLADVTTLEPLRDKIGMSNTRSPYTGGATIGPEIFRFFRALGLDLREIYGSSEAGLCCCHVGGDIKFETIGPPMPGMEAKITEEGELWWKGTSVASGYYKNPEKTAESFAEGWFKSGDAAYLDEDGHIIFLDRMKDMMELAGGKKFAPQFIESRLKFSPYIRDVIVVGGGEERPYPAVLVQIDFAIVGRWAERNHIPYTTFTDLSQKPQVYDLVEKDLMKVNRALPEGGRVKKFICLHKELDPDEAELTRTRKLRREFVETKYGGMLKAMYEDKDAFQAESEIKYRDGRKGKTTTSVQIRKLF